MTSTAETEQLRTLIPDLREWDEDTDALTWICGTGSPALAIGYSHLFWPRFVVIEDHVLRDGASAQDFAEWATTYQGDPRRMEALINHIHIADIHGVGPEPSEAQLRYLGRVLREIHQAKLARDFPDRRFVVEFPDEPGLDLIHYELTFWEERQG